MSVKHLTSESKLVRDCQFSRKALAVVTLMWVPQYCLCLGNETLYRILIH